MRFTIVFAGGSVMRYCRFIALAAVSSTRSRECNWLMAASRLWTLRPRAERLFAAVPPADEPHAGEQEQLGRRNLQGLARFLTALAARGLLLRLVSAASAAAAAPTLGAARTLAAPNWTPRASWRSQQPATYSSPFPAAP